MESPETWDSVTASLAVSDLSQPNTAWAFLSAQKLVREGPDDRHRFIQLIQQEQARGPITGPSLEARVSAAMTKGGLKLPAGKVADPNAKMASERLKTYASINQDE